MTSSIPALAPATPSSAAPVVLPSRASLNTPSFNGRQTLMRAIIAEWIKLTSLRSTWITSAIALIMTVGLGSALVLSRHNMEGGQDSWTMIPIGTTFGQIVVAVLGVLIASGEYSCGQIRSSLAAVPKRSRLFIAKAVVIGTWSFVLGAISMLTTWAIGAAVIGDDMITLSDHRMLGYVWGSGLVYAGVALMSVGLGFALRSTAGAITTVVVLFFVLPIPLQLASIQFKWAGKRIEALPSNVAQSVADPFSVITTWHEADPAIWLTHTQAVAACAAWVVVPMIAGWLVLTRRDA